MPISGEKTRRIRERGILGAVGLDEERGTSRGLVASFSFRFSFSPRNFFFVQPSRNNFMYARCSDAYDSLSSPWRKMDEKLWSNREPRSRILISLVKLPVISVLFRISRHRNSIPPEFFPRHSERISPFERHRCEATYLRSSRKKGKKRHVRCSSFGFIDALAFSFDKAFVLPRFISTPRAALIPSPLAKHSNLPWNSLSLSLSPSFSRRKRQDARFRRTRSSIVRLH